MVGAFIVVSLVVVAAPHLVANGSFEKGDPLPERWKPMSIEGGEGTAARDTSVAHSGKASLRIEKTQGCFGVVSEQYRADRHIVISASCWVRCRGAGRAYISLSWCAPDRWLENSVSQFVQGDSDWQQLLVKARPPEGAVYFEVILRADDTSGTVWFDDVQVQAEVDHPELDISLLVNQVGWDVSAPKRVVLQATKPLEDVGELEIAQEGKVVARFPFGQREEVEKWKMWYWVADISSLQRPGRYVAQVTAAGRAIKSPPFTIAPNRLVAATAELAERFFFIQRCGCEVPGWHKACHLDDARLPGGRHIDATGGWHDAGDYNKYPAATPLAVYALASLAASPAGQHVGKQPGPAEEALWGAQFLRKLQEPQTHRLVGAVFSGYGYWGPPEKETDNIAGNADDRPIRPAKRPENEMAAAAYAMLARLLGAEGKSWATGARELLDSVGRDERRPRHSAELLLACLALGDESLAELENRAVEEMLSAQTEDGRFTAQPLVHGGLCAAALASYLLQRPQASRAERIKQALRRFFQLCRRRTQNPFGILQWHEEKFFWDYQDPAWWHVGHNSQYLSTAWALLLIGRAMPELRAEALRLAQTQLDWVLGMNPYGICMLHGAGTHHVARQHHRYWGIERPEGGNVPGAVLNGIVRIYPILDYPWLDLHRDAWQTNEPWLPHNAYYLLVLAEWSRIFG